MPAPVIRIFSDLHYRDAASSLHRLDALVPLLAGADHVILNGDTLDSQVDQARPHIDEVHAFFAQHTRRTTFLSGNHDPDISAHAELSLENDRVWITHGDVFFKGIAPWSSLHAELLRRLDAISREVPADMLGHIETRLRLNRLACLNLPEPHDRFDRRLRTRLVRIAHNLFPPDRLLNMLRVWMTTPAVVRRLAQAQRPRARLVVLGHTHFPGVWHHRQGPSVINTGSFCRPFGARFVELTGDRVLVVHIDQKNGVFHRGRIVAGFSLAP